MLTRYSKCWPEVIIAKNRTAQPFRLEIASKIPDARAKVRQDEVVSLEPKVTHVQLADVYTIDKNLSVDQRSKIADALINPITQQSLNLEQFPDVKWVIEIGFLPGVTDNVGNTVQELVTDLLREKFQEAEHVYSSQLMLLSGDVTYQQVEKLALQFANPLIQRIQIISFAEYVAKNWQPVVPRVKLAASKHHVLKVELPTSDEALQKLSKHGITDEDGHARGSLALSLAAMKVIKNYFQKLGRQPTDVELESLAQTWSEHCKHTIFSSPIDDIKDGLFKHYIRRATEKVRAAKGGADFCVSVFHDNAGGIRFTEDYVVTDKVETHNTPSALDPFGGAITGIVGVNRDALGFGLGAKPILNRFGFCFAPPEDQTVLFRDQARQQPLLSARRIMEGVVAGVNSGGNCSGIPTTQGFVYFDKRYRGKPLVFVGTVGLIPAQEHGQNLTEKKALPGDFIVMVGGRVGLDGIHGATFSSEALDAGSPVTAVQIGDPITQKKMSDVLIKEARQQQLYRSITDNGAGGLSCSVAEMAKEAGGCEVNLDLVPVKYSGLAPWQIWISESQERMTLAVPPEKWPTLQKLLARRGVEAAQIGSFTNSGRCLVKAAGQTVMDLEMEFLHDGFPLPSLHTELQLKEQSDAVSDAKTVAKKRAKTDFSAEFITMLGRLSVGSFETISAQYDHEVQASSVLKPLQGRGNINGDASVVQPLTTSSKGIVLTHALYPEYSELNSYKMAVASVDTAIRNAVAAGADPDQIALLDNFCWCSPFEPERLGQLKEAARGCYDAAVGFNAPYISGKDSMFNDFKGFDEQGQPVNISVPPTLLISALAITNDVRKVVSPDFKMAGDALFVIGENAVELGGSEYYRMQQETGQRADTIDTVPSVNIAQNLKVYKALAMAIDQGVIASAQSIHRGGLAVALGKSAIGGQLGAKITINGEAEVALFSEGQGRILVSVAPQQQKTFAKIFKNVPVYKLGAVTARKEIEIYGENSQLIVQTANREVTKSYKQHFGRVDMLKPRAIVLAGYGLNCEEDTAAAFELAGGEAQVVHVNDLVDGLVSLDQFDILAVPGGFAYGDDTGSGNAYAWKLRNHLWQQIRDFVADDHLVIGICNGFQILVNLGLLPAIDEQYGERQVALLHNDSAKYQARWVDLEVSPFAHSPWLKGLNKLSLPIAHGEGKLFAEGPVLDKLKQNGFVAARYARGEIAQTFRLPVNPTGTVDNIAALTDPTGRILGLMPHPERAVHFTQLPHWTLLREKARRSGQELPVHGPGLALFQNAVSYFTD